MHAACILMNLLMRLAVFAKLRNVLFCSSNDRQQPREQFICKEKQTTPYTMLFLSTFYCNKSTVNSCCCSTSYSHVSSPLNGSRAEVLTPTSHFGQCTYLWRNSRKYVGRTRRTSLRVEARRRRPDPIVPPFIIKDSRGQEDYTDLYQHLLANRIVMVGSRITDEVATNVVGKLYALEALDSTKDIRLFINSQGGTPYAVIAIVDVLKYLKPDVSTICMGQCASTATLLLAAGTKGKRFSLPNARIMMHQPVGGAMGSADEVNITTRELNRTMRVVHRFYSDFTGQTIEKMEEETDRDNFMSPKQAVEMGLIDAIL